MSGARSSTATATTATADCAAPAPGGRSGPPAASLQRAAYRGRFAPTPSGLLHQGSLLAAVASWLDARAHGGAWLIRMEDLDTPRMVPGADAALVETLARFGMTPDEPILFQSQRSGAYREALDALAQAGLAYRCRCTRGERVTRPCHCRDRRLEGDDCAWRLHLTADCIGFQDRIQGQCRHDTASLGDPILLRRDGIFAYQLAVVVDDAFQRITDVVRGADLLESTAWQIALFEALQKPVPRYMHIPVLTEPDGAKLAKSRRSMPLERLDPGTALVEALSVLGIAVPEELKAATASDILHSSVQHWNPVGMSGIRAKALPLEPMPGQREAP